MLEVIALWLVWSLFESCELSTSICLEWIVCWRKYNNCLEIGCYMSTLDAKQIALRCNGDTSFIMSQIYYISLK